MITANGLAHLYDRLSVWERIPLLIAAEARGDEAEYRRLFDASALRTWQFPKHLLAEQALHVLTLIYVGEQLDAAANYFFALWKMEGPGDPQAHEWLHLAEACAYFFVVNADAWRRFCVGLDIDPDALTAANHRGWLLHYCKEHMPVNAPTAEALQDQLRKSGRGVPQLVTADGLLADWRNTLQAMTRHAPRESERGYCAG
jgi:hypothetical protein